jgi:hypothetical protein
MEEAGAELPNNFAKVLRVLLDDPARALQAGRLGLRRFVALVWVFRLFHVLTIEDPRPRPLR